ncbi:hypothetical protein N658DRAFT_498697 [Parathielavia hyrcaniae]|uniref:Uncharacterized protein n=1 Tax=Parathielavia hyrcaniae TaxID=113614 RepID=A0AAN6T006_9PEZI|nr:hypothetical protein N658DRAFT_498697 [Parathielavia hyrcaniae]
MPEHRGRRHHRHDDHAYEHPPRHRSLGRQALDKLEDAMSGLGLDNDSKSHHSHSTSSRRHSRGHSRDRAVERYYPPSSHSHGHRRYHSSSPTRRSSCRSRRDSTPHHHHHRGSSRSRSTWERGVEAGVGAGVAEAFRLRKEPGPWKGPKGERVATAAVSAAVLGASTEKQKQDHHHGGGKLSTLGSAVGGLVVNRLVNGPRDEVR